MRKQRVTQQGIVFGIFVMLFVGFALFLPGFSTPDNMIALLQNVAVLGILSLGMAIVIIGRGIDLSMIATLAVPAGLILQMVQNGHSVFAAFAAAAVLAVAFGLINGWLIAYAEVPSLFTTLASGLFLAGMGQAFFFQLDVVQWSEKLDPIAWVGRGALLGVPMPIIMFALAALGVAFFLRRTRLGAYVSAIGDNPFGARTTGIPTRPVIVLQYLLAALIGAFAGGLRQQHGDAGLQLDAHLRRHSCLRARRHRTFRWTRRRPECGDRYAADRHHPQCNDDPRRLLLRSEFHQGGHPAHSDTGGFDRQSAQRGDRSTRRYFEPPIACERVERGN